MRRRRSLVLLFGVVALGSCGGQNSGAPPAAFAPAPPAAGRRLAAPSASQGKIQHVVFIIQENRSFDDMFQGYPGANTASTGKDSTGQTVKLAPISLAAAFEISHFGRDFLNDYDNGKMDGFDLEAVLGDPGGNLHPQYGYVPHSEIRQYFAMAGQYVLADDMFASNLDASYVAHQYAIAAQANAAVDVPNGGWYCTGPSDQIQTFTQQRTFGPYIPVCQDYQTLGDELDAAGLSWRYYAYSKPSLWIAYGSIQHILNGPDWKNVIGSSSQVLSDVKNGKLAAVTWVTPTPGNSDHTWTQSKTGPRWVSSVVNAVGRSPFWNSTAIFVIWDEWGGWYDHVQPKYKDFDGLGFRIPLLIISPYAKQGYVTHMQYETGSVLRFIEDNFGLAPLAQSDARAADPANDVFDFTQPPRAFKPFTPALTMLEAEAMEQADRAARRDLDSQ